MEEDKMDWTDEMKRKSDYLQLELDLHWETWEQLGIDYFIQRRADPPPPDEYREKPERLYLSGERFAGALAFNLGEGWRPLYPYKPNCPLHDENIDVGVVMETWCHAVLASLYPPALIESTSEGSRTRAVNAIKKIGPLRTEGAGPFLDYVRQNHPALYFECWVARGQSS